MNILVDRLVIGLALFLLLESPAPAPLVPPILDDRRYSELVAETVARIPTHSPEWTNYRTSDPAFRLLDFFALLDPPVLEDLLIEDHMQPFWSTLPFEGEEYRGQFAYTWLDAALTSAEDPASVRSPTWLADHDIDPAWTFNELLSAANVPEPAGAMLLAGGAMLLASRLRRRERNAV
jgi:hypothetical protein